MVAVAADAKPLGLIALGDEIRPEAVEAIAQLRKAGLIPVPAHGPLRRLTGRTWDAGPVSVVLALSAWAVEDASAGGPDSGTLVAIVAGGAITFMTATVGQLLGEQFRRKAEVTKAARERTLAAADQERALLDSLLDAEQALALALDRDRALDLEKPGDPQAKDIRDADSRFRGLVPQVGDGKVRKAAGKWREVARDYAATRLGDRGGPRLADVTKAEDALNEAIGTAKRRLNKIG